MSPQFGVVEARDGSLLLVAQDGFDPTIRAWRADRPEGPWDAPAEIGRIRDQPAGRHNYNAVPHPQLSNDGSLVVVDADDLPGGGTRPSTS